MKQYPILKTFVFLSSLLFLSACEKDDSTPDSPPIVYGNFSWTMNGATTVADSAICYLQITTIYAYKGGLVNTVELNLSDVVQNTYPVNATSGNEIKVVKNSTSTIANSGTVTITSNTGSRLAGNFSGVLTGTVGTISGQFSEIRFR